MVRLITELARKLRREETKFEKIFWNVVRNRKLSGLKFFRQFPFEIMDDDFKKCFIADFYCPELKLIVEIDGEIHEHQKEYDDYRTEVLNSLEIEVVRFKNQEITNNLAEVLDQIKSMIPLSRIERG